MTIFHKYTVLYCKKIVPNSTETLSNGFIGFFQMRPTSNIKKHSNVLLKDVFTEQQLYNNNKCSQVIYWYRKV